MIWQLVFLGILMGMNNAMAAVALGTSNMPRKHQAKTALTFGILEAIMPIIGLLIGAGLASLVGNAAKYAGVGVIVVLAVYLLLKPSAHEEGPRKTGVQGIVLAVALSLDNLTVGFGLGMIQIPIALAAIVFGLISLTMTFIGLELGRLVGKRLKVSADKLSGVALLVVAVVMWYVQ